MPNHVHNDVTISGPAKVLREIVEAIRGTESAFDFNKIIPMSQELKGTTSDFSPVTLEQKELIKKYGARNWYEWSILNWGTKWDAYDVSKLTLKQNIRVNFLTAWSSPEPVFKAMKDKWPSITIKVKVGGEVDQPYSYTL